MSDIVINIAVQYCYIAIQYCYIAIYTAMLLSIVQ